MTSTVKKQPLINVSVQICARNDVHFATLGRCESSVGKSDPGAVPVFKWVVRLDRWWWKDCAEAYAPTARLQSESVLHQEKRNTSRGNVFEVPVPSGALFKLDIHTPYSLDFSIVFDKHGPPKWFDSSNDRAFSEVDQ